MAALLYRFNILSASKSTRGRKEEEAEKATKNPIPQKRNPEFKPTKSLPKNPQTFQRPIHTTQCHVPVPSLSLPPSLCRLCAAALTRTGPDRITSFWSLSGRSPPPSPSLSPPRRPGSTRPQHATPRLLPIRSGRAAYVGLWVHSHRLFSFRFAARFRRARARVRGERGIATPRPNPTTTPPPPPPRPRRPLVAGLRRRLRLVIHQKVGADLLLLLLLLEPTRARVPRCASVVSSPSRRRVLRWVGGMVSASVWAEAEERGKGARGPRRRRCVSSLSQAFCGPFWFLRRCSSSSQPFLCSIFVADGAMEVADLSRDPPEFFVSGVRAHGFPRDEGLLGVQYAAAAGVRGRGVGGGAARHAPLRRRPRRRRILQRRHR